MTRTADTVVQVFNDAGYDTNIVTIILENV